MNFSHLNHTHTNSLNSDDGQSRFFNHSTINVTKIPDKVDFVPKSSCQGNGPFCLTHLRLPLGQFNNPYHSLTLNTSSSSSSSSSSSTLSRLRNDLPNSTLYPYAQHSYTSLVRSTMATANNDTLVDDCLKPLNTHMDQFHPRMGSRSEDPKPNYSYIGLIAKAILSTTERRMILSEIYQWIQMNYPYFRTRGPGWRNSIRHNLSLNDCFIKVGRAANGKGHYWGIHPANLKDFLHGDFRRRRAQRKVRQALGLSCPTDDRDTPSPCMSPEPNSILFMAQSETPTQPTAPSLYMTRLGPPYAHLTSENSNPTPGMVPIHSSPQDAYNFAHRFSYPLAWPVESPVQKPPSQTNMTPLPTLTQNPANYPLKEIDPMLRLIYANLLNMLNPFSALKNSKPSKISSPDLPRSPTCKTTCPSAPAPLEERCSFSVVNLLDNASPKLANQNSSQLSLANLPDSDLSSLDSLDHGSADLQDSASLTPTPTPTTTTTNGQSFGLLITHPGGGQDVGDAIHPLDYTLARSNVR